MSRGVLDWARSMPDQTSRLDGLALNTYVSTGEGTWARMTAFSTTVVTNETGELVLMI